MLVIFRGEKTHYLGQRTLQKHTLSVWVPASVEKQRANSFPLPTRHIELASPARQEKLPTRTADGRFAARLGYIPFYSLVFDMDLGGGRKEGIALKSNSIQQDRSLVRASKDLDKTKAVKTTVVSGNTQRP